ncbi:hypothetical protein BH23ACT10_BH23ACT10_36910 [soil metagenome]
MRSTVLELLEELGPRSRHARLLMATAAAWAVSGAVHIGVWAVAGGSLSGAVSWRKPIVFSISIGLTLWAVGWVLDRMPTSRSRLAGAIAWTFAVASTIETALIVMQTWRGRASHFNVFAAGDAVVFGVMGFMVGVMSLALITLFVWTLIEPPGDTATRWAVVAGLAAVVAGLGFGQWLITLGTRYASEFAAVPSTVMNGGAVAKFPHAVGFHGIQVFALLGALCKGAGVGTARRSQAMRSAVAGYAGLLVFATIQTVGGLAPLALRPWSLALLAASGLALAWAFSTVFAARRRRRVPATLAA